MEFIKLGNSDLEVSKLCLGTMTFGEQNSQEDGFEQMDYALEQGINFFDTAELYSIPARAETQGSTEKILGNYFEERKNREQVILASKVTGPGMKWIRDGKGYNGKTIREALDASLKRLKTDYIDLYQLHWPMRPTYQFTEYFSPQRKFNKEETEAHITENIQTLSDLIKEGKIKHYGLSNETAWGSMKYLEIAKNSGLPAPISIQNEYSLLCRKFEPELAEVSMAENLALLAWSPLSGGLLSGKYLHGNYPKGARLSSFIGHRWRQKENTEAALEAYKQVAEKHKTSLAKLAIAFTAHRPFTSIPILGATKMTQLKENIDAFKLKLSEEILNDINEVRKKFPIVY